MTRREVKPILPTSGRILGTVIRKLQVSNDGLGSKNAQRYFRGSQGSLVKDSSKREIFKAIAELLISIGVIPVAEDGSQDEVAIDRISEVIEFQAMRWDRFRDFVLPRMNLVEQDHLGLVWKAYLRLAAIDLAVRASAYLYIMRSQKGPGPTFNLIWSDPTKRGDYLNQMRETAGFTLEEFAEAVQVSDNTVDGWIYNDVRPRDKHVVEIVEALLSRTPVDEDVAEDQITEVIERVTEILTNELRIFYWWSEIVDLLIAYVGRDSALDISRHMRKYAMQARMVLESMPESQEYAFAVMDMLFYGSRQSLAQAIIQTLETYEKDEEWKEDLRHVSEDWVGRVLPIILEVNNSEVDALIESTNGRLLKDWDVNDPKAFYHYRKSMELQVQSRIKEAIAEVEIAAQLDPTDPVYHFTLGSVIGGLGAKNGDNSEIQRGLDKCWIANCLDPNWILPWAEIGFILHNAGRSQEALDHLLSVSEDCGPLDARYYGALGAAQRELGAINGDLELLKDALTSFEEGFSLDKDSQAMAIAAAATAHMAGNKTKYRKYLRIARHLGASTDEVELLSELHSMARDYLITPPQDLASNLWLPR